MPLKHSFGGYKNGSKFNFQFENDSSILLFQRINSCVDFFFLLKNLYKFVEAIFETNPYPSPNFFVWGFPHEKIYLILYAQDNLPLGKKFKYIFQNFLYIIAI